MGRRAKVPVVTVLPVSSKKQLLQIEAVCQFLGGISRGSLENIRNDKDLHFPKPLQILGQTPLWSLDQIERFIARNEKQLENLVA